MVAPENYLDEGSYEKQDVQKKAQSLIVKYGDHAYEMASFLHDELLLSNDYEHADRYVSVMLYLIYEYGIGSKHRLLT